MDCDICRKAKPDVNYRIDPYNADVNDDEVWMYLCDDCYSERAADV
jgi:hypothetical protein